MGKTITTFLQTNFPTIMEYKFTSDMEENLDKIAEGKLIWHQVLKYFYDKFHPLIEGISKDNIKIIDTNSKYIGTHPENGKKIYATLGKYGPVLKMEEGNNKFSIAPIKLPLDINTVTILDAVKIYEYPKIIGKHKRSTVYFYNGKYGPYLKIGKEKYQIKVEEGKEFNEDELNMDYVQTIIEKNTQNNLWYKEHDKSTYTILNGPYGKYVSIKNIGNKNKPYNVSLPDNLDLENLKIDQLKDIIEAKNKKKKVFIKKK